jgi:hypothetical protein
MSTKALLIVLGAALAIAGAAVVAHNHGPKQLPQMLHAVGH